MIFACQHCGGIEPYIIAGAVAAWSWGCYMLARVFGWLRPMKPEGPKQKTWYYRLWRKP